MIVVHKTAKTYPAHEIKLCPCERRGVASSRTISYFTCCPCWQWPKWPVAATWAKAKLYSTGINDISQLFSFHNICAYGYSSYVLALPKKGQINIVQCGRDLQLRSCAELHWCRVWCAWFLNLKQMAHWWKSLWTSIPNSGWETVFTV